MTSAVRPGGDFEVRDADESAASLLAAIMDAGDGEAWSADSLTTILRLPTTCALLALDVGEPAGFLLLQVAAQEAEVINLVVAPPSRRRGIGRILLAAAKEKAREMGAQAMFLEVASDNDAAKRLYAASGFRQVGLRPDYYRKGPINYTDGLILRCQLITRVCD